MVFIIRLHLLEDRRSKFLFVVYKYYATLISVCVYTVIKQSLVIIIINFMTELKTTPTINTLKISNSKKILYKIFNSNF